MEDTVRNTEEREVVTIAALGSPRVAPPTTVFSTPNTIYKITTDLDFGNTSTQVTVGANSVLDFQGGSIRNCTLNVNGVWINAPARQSSTYKTSIFHDCAISVIVGAVIGPGILNDTVELDWFSSSSDNYPIEVGTSIERALEATKVGQTLKFGSAPTYSTNHKFTLMRGITIDLNGSELHYSDLNITGYFIEAIGSGSAGPIGSRTQTLTIKNGKISAGFKSGETIRTSKLENLIVVGTGDTMLCYLKGFVLENITIEAYLAPFKPGIYTSSTCVAVTSIPNVKVSDVNIVAGTTAACMLYIGNIYINGVSFSLVTSNVDISNCYMESINGSGMSLCNVRGVISNVNISSATQDAILLDINTVTTQTAVETRTALVITSSTFYQNRPTDNGCAIYIRGDNRQTTKKLAQDVIITGCESIYGTQNWLNPFVVLENATMLTLIGNKIHTPGVTSSTTESKRIFEANNISSYTSTKPVGYTLGSVISDKVINETKHKIGDKAGRTASFIGDHYFDTSINRPIWYIKPGKWADAAGAVVPN